MEISSKFHEKEFIIKTGNKHKLQTVIQSRRNPILEVFKKAGLKNFIKACYMAI
jgi:hypothetical protein